VDVRVSQSLTSLLVTPGSASLRAGTSLQFVAAARDQFDRSMAAQPAFSWTATAGSIGADGVYRAPNQATTARVTATAAGRQASAAVTITDSPSGLLDPELASLLDSLFADQAIDRNDMIQLLRAAGSDNGSIDGKPTRRRTPYRTMCGTLPVTSSLGIAPMPRTWGRRWAIWSRAVQPCC
jgi:hypothetical protein